MKSKTILLFMLFFGICVNSFSQVDPNEPVSNTFYPLRFEFPKVYTQEPYGVDVIISVGAFDNYQVSTSAGFAETDIAVNPRDPLNFVASDNRVRIFRDTINLLYN